MSKRSVTTTTSDTHPPEHARAVARLRRQRLAFHLSTILAAIMIFGLMGGIIVGRGRWGLERVKVPTWLFLGLPLTGTALVLLVGQAAIGRQRCPRCGAAIVSLRQRGLDLHGSCPGCGLVVGMTWRRRGS